MKIAITPPRLSPFVFGPLCILGFLLSAWTPQVPAIQQQNSTDVLISDSVIVSPGTGLPARSEVEAFLDGLMAAYLEENHIAGATVSIVQGDSLFLAKGYGFADLENREPVRADETLFRIGSISKLFVWTAVMQLVEEGKIDLHADVNQYLEGIEVPGKFGEPVTMADLMTHTAGFEDQVIGLFARDMSKLRPLEEILRDELPERVYPPGQIASYSNHGTGLAALIVERVSGMAWDEYVERNILDSLGMQQTTFRQPVPERLAAGVSKGYSYAGGEFKEEGFEFVPLAPVGAASATATDMARFMRAHLNLGRLGDAVILDIATARRMQTPLFIPGPGVNAIAHGFIELSWNGYRAIGHAGDTFWFHSILALLPEQNVGIFISFNSGGAGSTAVEAYKAFMDQFFAPREVPELVTDAEAPERLERFEGSYRPVRYSHTTIAKLAAAFSSIDVTVTEDSRLKTTGPETIYWIERGPRSFREEHGLRRLAFREEDGDVTHLLLGELPIVAFERVGFLEQRGVQFGLLVVAALILLLAFIGWPLGARMRRRYGVKLEKETSIPAAARLVAWLMSFLLVVFLVLFVVGMGDPNQIVYGIPATLQAGFWLPRIALVLAVVGLLMAVVLWLSRRGRIGARLWYTSVVLAGGVLLWQLYHWNLLNFDFMT